MVSYRHAVMQKGAQLDLAYSSRYETSSLAPLSETALSVTPIWLAHGHVVVHRCVAVRKKYTRW